LKIPSIRIYHNNLWARYKGAIFSKVYAMSADRGVSTAFVQVAETSIHRTGFGGVDRSYHRYPFTLMFAQSYDQIPSYQLLKALSADLLKNPTDLVVLPGYHRIEYWAMLIICILRRRKRAVFCDSTAFDREKSYWKEKAKAFFFRRCDGFLCYGIRSKEYIAGYGIDEKIIFDRCQAAALPHNYDAAAIRAHYERNSLGAGAASKFLFVGRLAKEKGLFDLLDAFCRIREHIPDATLDMVGSGLLDEKLGQRTRELGIDSVVRFLGTRTPEEIGRLLMSSAAMILPSYREPWGLVVNEALSFGCPVVVSNICGCLPELVHDGVTGYSFPAGDVDALAKAMIGAAQLSKDRSAVARRCMDLIEQYTPERAASEILSGCVWILKTPQ
jgi:glycosyltransferase involved in cell wall biosynthesis